jgi:hypothetical protein
VTKPFLITGCGRSGTGWAAALFTELGYPCDHEGLFNRDVGGAGYFAMSRLAVPESSWMAVPFLGRVREEVPVLRIMRNPYKVVQSIITCGFLDRGDHYDEFVRHHRPDIVSPWDHLGRAIRYVALWDEPLAAANVLQVEGNTYRTTRAVRQATGERVSRRAVSRAREQVGTVVNAKSVDQWLDIPTRHEIDADPDGILIRIRAEQFGYAEG